MMKDGDKGVILQRDRKTYAVAPHIPCGVVTPDLLRRLADVAERYPMDTMKITSAQTGKKMSGFSVKKPFAIMLSIIVSPLQVPRRLPPAGRARRSHSYHKTGVF